jgi:hypothetical protein
MMIFNFIMAHATAFAIGSLFIITLTAIAALVCMAIAMNGLRIALGELKRARMEIREHAPMKVANKKSFDERRKEEYEKRGIPWEG